MDDSDSSELSDDSILGHVTTKAPSVSVEAAPSPSLDIPSIFLVEGEKNRKLLQQNQEIQSRIAEDQRKAEEKRQSYKLLRLSILEELNDNGSDYLFTIKNDSALIEKYVEMTQNSDPALLLERHFYFFRNVSQVRFKDMRLDGSLLSLVDRYSPLIHNTAQFTKLVRNRNIELKDVVFSALESASEPALFLFLFNWIAEFSPEGSSEEQDFEEVFIGMMEGVGADCNLKHPVVKLVLFNNNIEVLVYRLRLVYLFCLRYNNSNEFCKILVKYFILSSSDYHLNKRWKTGLVDIFMIPTFSALTELFSEISPTKLAHLIHDELSSLEIGVLNDPNDQRERAFELHYTFLDNLLRQRAKLNTRAQSVLGILVCQFLELDNFSSILIACLSSILSKFPTPECSTNLGLATKGMYFIKIIMIVLMMQLSDWRKHERLDFYGLQKVLLSTKNAFQQAIGSQELVLVQMTKRQILSSTLSECYHDLDYLLTVLDKTIILMRDDEFYQD